jgi:hypothetical protein
MAYLNLFPTAIFYNLSKELISQAGNINYLIFIPTNSPIVCIKLLGKIKLPVLSVIYFISGLIA